MLNFAEIVYFHRFDIIIMFDQNSNWVWPGLKSDITEIQQLKVGTAQSPLYFQPQLKTEKLEYVFDFDNFLKANVLLKSKSFRHATWEYRLTSLIYDKLEDYFQATYTSRTKSKVNY